MSTNQTPKSRIESTVRRRADGRCEGCGRPSDEFIGELNVHRVVPGEVEIELATNYLALCPSCLRRATGDRDVSAN